MTIIDIELQKLENLRVANQKQLDQIVILEDKKKELETILKAIDLSIRNLKEVIAENEKPEAVEEVVEEVVKVKPAKKQC